MHTMSKKPKLTMTPAVEAAFAADEAARREPDQRDRRIAELKQELEEAYALLSDLTDAVQDADDMIEQWVECFEMVPNDDGVYQWSSSFIEDEVNVWFGKYMTLAADWNKFVDEYNTTVRGPRNVGRPLAASEAQCKEVRRLRHKVGMSLREIAEETSLGLNTVRTIIDKDEQVDRTTFKHLERIAPDRARMKKWQARSRTRKELPKRIHALRENLDELRKRAKGFA